MRVKAEAKHRTTTVDAAALAGAVEADPDVARAAEATSAARAAAQAATSTTKANTTDPDSRITKTASGWLQGYNVQGATRGRTL